MVKLDLVVAVLIPQYSESQEIISTAGGRLAMGG